MYVNVTDKLSASEVKALYESNADTNAYTDEEKTRLAGIEALAEVNIVEGVKVDSVLLTPDGDRIVNVDLSGYVENLTADDLPAHNHTKSEITDFPTIPTVPTISIDITTDATSDIKTASPKAVKTYVDNTISTAIGDIDAILDSILGV